MRVLFFCFQNWGWGARMDKQYVVWGSIGAVLVPAFEFLYGAGDTVKFLIGALFLCIVLDWLSGTRASEKDDSYGSRYGIDGVFRSIFILTLPVVGHLISSAYSIPPVIPGAIIAALLYHIIKSMVANAIRAGWGDWLPLWLFELLFKWVQSEIENKVKRALSRGGSTTEGDING